MATRNVPEGPSTILGTVRRPYLPTLCKRLQFFDLNPIFIEFRPFHSIVYTIVSNHFCKLIDMLKFYRIAPDD